MNEHLKRAICLLMSMLLVFSGIPVYAQEAEQELSSGACVNTPAPELILPDAAETALPDPTPSASATPSETLEPLDTSESTAVPDIDTSIEPPLEENTSTVAPDRNEENADSDAESAEDRIPSLEDLNALSYPSPETEFIIEDTRLTAYCGEGGDVVVPDGVTVIGAAAFNYCSAITSIILPETLLTIEENAFAGCVALEKLHIPASVNEITELNSLFQANPDVRIELSYGSYAEQFCIDQGFDYRWFDHEEPAPILPTELIPAQTSIVLGVGQTISVANWTLLPAGAQDSVIYKSKSTKIASVSADGIVTAKKTGSTTITLTSAAGLTASIKLTVKKAPSSIKIRADRTQLGVGEELQLGYTITSKTAAAIAFESMNPEIASVTPDGKVFALAPGMATIQAKTHNNKKSTIQLTICPAPEAVIPALNELRIGAEDSYTLGYVLNEGAAGEVHFTSADESVATVDATGKIYAITEGETQITVETYNGMQGVCNVSVVPAPNGISLSAAKTTLGVNETLQLNTLIDPEGTLGTITYKSSKSSTVSVDANGLVKAKRTGTATITATTYNGKTAAIKITVKKAPSSIKISADRTKLGVGEELQLGYTITAKTAAAVSFESLNPEIASVTSNGKVVALTSGTATIQAKTHNNKKSTIQLTICPAPEAVIPALNELRIGAEDSYTLGYALNEGAAGEVYFTSADEAIATVDATGKIYAITEGETLITIETYNGMQGVCNVFVVPAPNGISLSAAKTTLGVNETLQLNTLIDPEGTLGTIAYKSSKSSTVSVDANGLVKAKRTGTATITATTYNGKTAAIKFTVKNAPTSVNIKMDRSVLGVGEEMLLGYTLPKNSVGEVSFESLNPEILQVRADGRVTALSVGTGMIRATTYNGKKRTAAIEVKPAPDFIILSEQNLSISQDDHRKLSYSLNTGSAGAVCFESDHPEIASVDGSGNIQANSIGTARIIASSYNGISSECIVSVVPAPESIDVSSLRTKIGLKETVQLQPKLLPAESAASLKYKSSKTSVVSVNSDGVLTGKKTGSATITVSTYNGVTASFKVNVEKAATGVKITAERDQFGAGEETDFTAKVTGVGAVRFESSDPDIMSIDPQTGHAVAVTPGQVKISACTYNEKVASRDIIVTAAPAEIYIHPSEITIGLGDTMQLSASLPDGIAGTYTFSSSDPSIASIDPLTGEMQAVALGTASICATAYNGVTAAATVNVIEAPSQLTLRGLEQNDEGVYLLNLTCGEITDIEPDTGEYSVIHCLYSASDAVAEVSPNGRITAKSYGDCMITVSTYSETASVQLLVHVDRLLNRYPDPNVIMHAMGAVDGHVYTNSREAFLSNYARGNRMFEVDLQYTSDNQLVLWHNWNTNRINSSKKAGYVPTEKEFASMLIYDQYDSLTYKDLLKLMDEYPDAYFYMDTKKTAAKDVRKQYQKMVSDAKSMGLTHVLDRMVVMIYNESMYDVVHSVYPFSHYVL